MSEIEFPATAQMSMEDISQAVRAVWAKVEYDRSDEPEEPETVESYAQYCRVNNIDLAHSVVARDEGGHVIGISMLGVRGDRGWCGDFGVIPQWRGRGVGHRLMAAFIAEARALGLRSLQLEVRQDNHPAIKVYERAGYLIRRSALELIAARQDLRFGDASMHKVTTTPASPHDVLHWYGEPFSPIPLWERELPSLLATDNAQAWVSQRDGRDRAFLLYEAQGSRSYASILHLGATPEANEEDFGALLAAALSQDPAMTQVIFGGVLEGDRTIEWIVALGFRQVARLYEMVFNYL